HTRWPRDWSSDVCSSDLPDRLAGGEVRARLDSRLEVREVAVCPELAVGGAEGEARAAAVVGCPGVEHVAVGERVQLAPRGGRDRSEERRVGKEGRAQGWG